MEEKVKSNRRKIYGAEAMYFFILLGVTAALAYWILSSYPHPLGWVATTLFMALNLLFIYYAGHCGLAVVRWVSRATPIYPGGFQEVKDLLNDVSIATGMPMPEVMYVDENFANIFSLKQGEKRVIIFTHGLLKRLNREELRAAIAHEMAHLYNEDATLNTFIASLRGFSLFARLIWDRLTGKTIENPMVGAFIERFVAPLIWIALATITVLFAVFAKNVSEVYRIISSLLILVTLNMLLITIIGLVLQRLIDPYREFLADELAVEWTMNPEALASALRKTEVHCTAARLNFLQGVFFAPIRIIRFEDKWEFDLQPRVDERIENLQKFTHMLVDPGRIPYPQGDSWSTSI